MTSPFARLVALHACFYGNDRCKHERQSVGASKFLNEQDKTLNMSDTPPVGESERPVASGNQIEGHGEAVKLLSDGFIGAFLPELTDVQERVKELTYEMPYSSPNPTNGPWTSSSFTLPIVYIKTFSSKRCNKRMQSLLKISWPKILQQW